MSGATSASLRRPVAWAGINMVLRHMHIYLDDKCEAERKPRGRSLLENTGRWLAGQDEPGWQKREWHGDSADDEGDEEVGGTLAEPAGVA
jgi:hypothetical protein